MPCITAILHTHNDASRIARAVESLRPCDEVLLIDHDSSDDTCQVASVFGARVMAALPNTHESSWMDQAANDWILCVRPTEAVSEALEASLLEWKLNDAGAQTLYGVSILEETVDGWISHPAEARLVHRKHLRRDGKTPVAGGTLHALDGYLTRLRLP